MHARVELLGLKGQAQWRRAPKDAQRAAVEAIHEQAKPMVHDMQGATFTKIQRHAARSIAVREDRLGIELRGAAGGTTLDRALYYGGEYGGRKPRRVTYATRSPAGRVYVVRRRTTMQFLPHLGREGYFMWPTVREHLPLINQAIGKAVAKVLGG